MSEDVMNDEDVTEHVRLIDLDNESDDNSLRVVVQMSTDHWLAVKHVLDVCDRITKAAKARELSGATVKSDGEEGIAGAKLAAFLSELVRFTSAPEVQALIADTK